MGPFLRVLTDPPRLLLLPHPGGRQFAGVLGGQVLGHRECFDDCTSASGKSLSVRKAVRACGGSAGLGAIGPGIALKFHPSLPG